LKHGDGIDIFAVSRVNDGKVNRQGGGTQIGAIAEDDFAQDNRMTQGLLGVVVGGRHSVDSKEGKETVVIALGVEQALAQSFGFFFRDGFFANEMKAALEVRDLRFGIGEGNGLRVSKTPQAAGIAKEFAQSGVEAQRLGILS